MNNSQWPILWKSLYTHHFSAFLVLWEHHNYVVPPPHWNNSSLLIWKSYSILHKHSGRVVILVHPKGVENLKYYLIKREVNIKIKNHTAEWAHAKFIFIPSRGSVHMREWQAAVGLPIMLTFIPVNRLSFS